MTIKIILKNGIIIPVKCDKFALKSDEAGEAMGYEIKGISDNKPIYVNWNDISAIVRMISDEEDDPSC